MKVRNVDLANRWTINSPHEVMQAGPREEIGNLMKIKDNT
jgi:hypothetical protein